MNMNNLSNLRYLSYGKLNFPRIGKLKFLQEVKGFCIKNENGYRIDELEHINDLRSLEIFNIQDVKDAEEACNARLSDKTKLTKLSLYWKYYLCLTERNNADPDLDEKVLDNLQPHNHLHKLDLYKYMGVRSAIWMNEAHLIHNLQKIRLCDCLEWEILPPFGQLPFLKTLWLENMPKVKQIENKFLGNDMCSVFPSLEILHFENFEAMVDWFDASIVEGLFPCLTELFIFHCPNLQELSCLPPKLESLEIKKHWVKEFELLQHLKFYSHQNIRCSGLSKHHIYFSC